MVQGFLATRHLRCSLLRKAMEERSHTASHPIPGAEREPLPVPVRAASLLSSTRSLDQRVQKTIDLDELEADFFPSFEYDKTVTLIRSYIYLDRPSAVPSLVAVQSTRAPSPDFTITRHGETVALPSGSKRTVEVDNVANMHSACGPRICNLHVRTAGEDSHSLEQLAELAPDSLEGQLDTPSSPPSDDCVLLAEGQVAGLSKDLVTTTYNDAADPDQPSLRFSDGSDAAVARRSSLLREHAVGRRERAPFPPLHDGGHAAPGTRFSSGVYASRNLHL